MNEKTGKSDDGIVSSFKHMGLHFCRRYKNLVRYNPEFCGTCPFNGFRVEAE